MYTLPTGKFEISDFNLNVKSSVTDDFKVNKTIDDIRLRSILTTNKTIKFTKKSLMYTILGFTQEHSGTLGDFEGFFHLIPDSYKSVEPINVTGIDKVHTKCDSINGSKLDGVRESILYSFALDKTPGHKLNLFLSHVNLFRG